MLDWVERLDLCLDISHKRVKIMSNELLEIRAIFDWLLEFRMQFFNAFSIPFFFIFSSAPVRIKLAVI